MQEDRWYGAQVTLSGLLLGVQNSFATSLTHLEKRMVAYAYQMGMRDCAEYYKHKAGDQTDLCAEAMRFAQRGEFEE